MTAPVDANAASPINDPQPRLSPEICERIIDHLDPFWPLSRRTLLNCALVCRGWYAESRVVLFEMPVLRTREEAIACARSLTQIPLLGARLRHLTIADPSGPKSASILVMLAGKLPKLASLHFYSVSFEHCSMRNSAFWSLHEFNKITSLQLVRVTLPSARPFFQVICSFPRLEHLFCQDLRWSVARSTAPLPEHHHMPLTRVASLEYDLSCFEGIGHILLGLLDQAILETLDLHPQVSAAALAFTQHMLDIAGKRLKDITITFRASKEDGRSNIQPLLLFVLTDTNFRVTLRALKAKQLTNKQPRPAEQAAT
ncbi:uncharacterized protein LAESUDRAFT_759589 [Laetiporus sulphureus 93-53]|uniref:F-box domain-containing protein n=1 Tax=Laetiporus sulphureus 93-53 TaxID=1314785 RepID=A0A165E129_9APHY|nr:uncharacterized protein LAESUDRAFT_759589 [Laetiporus sulphureus 93-53]KZT06046.1 hypothetical protein LAESUDRAFT_759589 [Laetiporus sulphureus 93-53]